MASVVTLFCALIITCTTSCREVPSDAESNVQNIDSIENHILEIEDICIEGNKRILEFADLNDSALVSLSPTEEYYYDRGKEVIYDTYYGYHYDDLLEIVDDKDEQYNILVSDYNALLEDYKSLATNYEMLKSYYSRAHSDIEMHAERFADIYDKAEGIYSIID